MTEKEIPLAYGDFPSHGGGHGRIGERLSYLHQQSALCVLPEVLLYLLKSKKAKGEDNEPLVPQNPRGVLSLF